MSTLGPMSAVLKDYDVHPRDDLRPILLPREGVLPFDEGVL
jgi:hypothetical protein